MIVNENAIAFLIPKFTINATNIAGTPSYLRTP